MYMGVQSYAVHMPIRMETKGLTQLWVMRETLSIPVWVGFGLRQGLTDPQLTKGDQIGSMVDLRDPPVSSPLVLQL